MGKTPRYLETLHQWLNKWCIKEKKSVHATFITRRESCPAMYLTIIPFLKWERLTKLACISIKRSLGAYLDKDKTAQLYWLLSNH